MGFNTSDSMTGSWHALPKAARTFPGSVENAFAGFSQRRKN